MSDESQSRASRAVTWMYGPDHAPVGLLLWQRWRAARRRGRWLRQIRDPRNWR